MKKNIIIFTSIIVIIFLIILVFIKNVNKNNFPIYCESLIIYDVEAPKEKLSNQELEKYISNIKYYDITEYGIDCLHTSTRCNNMVLWKGDKLAIATSSEGEYVQLRISLYGDFFSIIGEKEYYVIDKSYKSTWSEIINLK